MASRPARHRPGHRLRLPPPATSRRRHTGRAPPVRHRARADGQLSRQPLGTRPVTRLSLKPQLIQVAVLGKQGREREAEPAVKGNSPAREFPDIHATGS